MLFKFILIYQIDSPCLVAQQSDVEVAENCFIDNLVFYSGTYIVYFLFLIYCLLWFLYFPKALQHKY